MVSSFSDFSSLFPLGSGVIRSGKKKILCKLQHWKQPGTGLRTDRRPNGTEQKTRIINPHIFVHLIFDKEAKRIKWKKESIFNEWCWHNWISTRRKMKMNSMHKTRVHMDQRPQPKVSHTEPYRRESGKCTWTPWHRESLPKYNPSSMDTERNN